MGLREVPFGDGSGGMTLGSQTVFAVTGAAGAIVSAIVADLAKASGGTFHLIDLAPEPDPADPDLIQFAADRDGLKKTIADRLAASGTRPTPVLIERELARCERLHSALIAIQAVRAAGGQAYYHAADLTDPGAVASVMADIRDRHGRVDVLLHAAGLDISRAIADKEPREYDLVFDVKSDGLFNLLHAAEGMPLGAVVAFSSVAGRFGNAGQTDYSRRQRPAVQDHVQLPRHPAGHQGDSRRLDGVGRPRHGDQGFDPEGDGHGGHRDAGT